MHADQLMDAAEAAATEIASLMGRLAELSGELGRRRSFAREGATALDTWMMQRLGISKASAQSMAQVATRLHVLPHLAAALSAGELSFDKVRAVLPMATPDNDAELGRQARGCSVRQLQDLAKSRRHRAQLPDGRSGRHCRLNDATHTITATLAPEDYAECRTILEAAARDIPSDGETRWDQRVGDAFLNLVRGGAGGNGPHRLRPHVVVVHAPLSTVFDGDEDLSAVGGELERVGLLDVATVRRIACDATIILGLDDDVGRTQYEGREHRFPTPTQRREVIRRDRFCRFPGCTFSLFTNVHHITPWTPAGLTNIGNLVLLCEHHHHTIHKKTWRVVGDANATLTFTGPSTHVMTSEPSPLWTTRSD
jgi:hypothetical protein